MNIRIGIVAALLAGLTALAGCVDDVDANNSWNVVESGQWESMEGPPGTIHRILGTVDGRLYADVGSGVLGFDAPMIAVCEPGEGWELDPEFSEIATTVPPSRSGREAIKQIGDTHYVAGGEHRLYRTVDGGETWQRQGSLPGGPTGETRLATDGQRLLFETRSDDAATVWGWEPDEESWEELRGIESDTDEGMPTFELRAAPGLAAIDGDEPMFSTDSGESWQQLDESCDGLFSVVMPHRPASSFEVDGQAVFGVGPELWFIDDEEGSCETFAPGPLAAGEATSGSSEEVSTAIRYASIDGTVYGLSPVGFGRLSDDLSGWSEVRELPVDSSLDLTQTLERPVVDLAGNDIGVALPGRGLWVTADEGGSWRGAHHGWSSPWWVLEEDGNIASRATGLIYRTEPGSGQWSVDEPDRDDETAPGKMIRRGDRIFGVSRGEPTVHQREENGEFRIIWPDERFEQGGLSSLLGPPGADLRFADGRVFVAVRGHLQVAERPATPPDSEHKGTAGQSVGIADGGLFAADSIENADFARFGDGFPVDEDGRPDGVVSMAVGDGAVWVVTSTRGVWRVDVEDEQWVPAHDGLPVGDAGGLSPEDDWPVTDLVRFGDELYGWSADRVYRWDGASWSSIHDRRFALEDGPPTGVQRPGVQDLIEFRGRLVVVHHAGVYEMDRDTGNHRRVWEHPDGRALSFGSVEPSGLYVGARNGGIWRHP